METRNVVKAAQEQDVKKDGKDWNFKYNLSEPKELHKFATNVYAENSEKPNDDEIELARSWKLLYRAQGTVLKKMLHAFYGELYFNTENHYLLLAVKGTSGLGNVWSDVK
jgi:hypothetical protein